MRGRTLNDAFVILDEAQNTTTEQMKMFLTRLGFGSKAVITGDITQIDLPTGRASGLVEAMKVVGEIEGISFIHFDERDVVRHKLVQQIVKAYEAFSSGNRHPRWRKRRQPGPPGDQRRAAVDACRSTADATPVARSRVRRAGRGLAAASPDGWRASRPPRAGRGQRGGRQRCPRPRAQPPVPPPRLRHRCPQFPAGLPFDVGARIVDHRARPDAGRKPKARRTSSDVADSPDPQHLCSRYRAVPGRHRHRPRRRTPAGACGRPRDPTELRVLALHGLLHLLGYDHERDAGRCSGSSAAAPQGRACAGGLIERAQR